MKKSKKSKKEISVHKPSQDYIDAALKFCTRQIDTLGHPLADDALFTHLDDSNSSLMREAILANIANLKWCSEKHGPDAMDPVTGKNYEIDGIIAFDKSVTTEKEGGFDKYSDYINKYFAPKLFALVNTEQHFKKPKDTNEDPCDMTELDLWKYILWIYTEKGIIFTPSFEHYRKGHCQEDFLVPFEKLRKYKNPKFPYQF